VKGKETLQALLDGKILMSTTNPGVRFYRINDGQLEFRWANSGGWGPCHTPFNNLMNAELVIYNEYYLTFEEAIKAMFNGKVVRSDNKLYSSRLYRFNDGVIESKFGHGNWGGASIALSEQQSKWKVVE